MTEPYALGTFARDDRPAFPGVVRAGMVLPLQNLIPNAPSELGKVFADWGQYRQAIDDALLVSKSEGWEAETEFIAQLPYRPEALFGAGANYRRHVIDLIVDKGVGGVVHLSRDDRRVYAEKEMDQRAASGKPFVFVASRRAVSGQSEPLVLPYDSSEPDWELELALIIGKRARRVKLDEAMEYVAGYTIANDITSRELVDRPDAPKMGMDWMACKNAPGYKIIGPYITPVQFVPDPQALHIRLSLNGEIMQDDGTSDMIFGVARLIEFISASVELLPGDVIMTGSPAGNGTHYNRYLREGDVMLGEIDGLIGSQTVHCVLEKPDST